MPRPLSPARRRAEEGSAYIITLLVLVVLTILGLTLVLLTQTEVQIAANQRVANRTIAAAETGLNTAMANMLVNNEGCGHIFGFVDTTASGGTAVGTQVLIPGIFPILEAPCNLCMINASKTYVAFDNATRAIAQRVRNPLGPVVDATTSPDAVLSQAGIALTIHREPVEESAGVTMTNCPVPPGFGKNVPGGLGFQGSDFAGENQ